jgi:hypothetical protein
MVEEVDSRKLKEKKKPRHGIQFRRSWISKTARVASCGFPRFSITLGTKKGGQYRPDYLSGLLCHKHPALQAPMDVGLSLRSCWRPALALPNLPHAISRAALAASHFVLCSLRELRQPRIAAHLRGARAWRACCLWADPEIAGAAVRPLPSQIFFPAAAATANTSCDGRAKRVAPTPCK